MTKAFETGHPVQLSAITSIARTLGAPSVSERTLAMAQMYLEKVILVSDAEAMAALQIILERAKVLAEPAASCTLAAAERLRERFRHFSVVVLVMCGGNVSIDDICRYKT